jgi:hypothetical protein
MLLAGPTPSVAALVRVEVKDINLAGQDGFLERVPGEHALLN